MTHVSKQDGTNNAFGYDGNDEAGNSISGLANSIGRLSHISNQVNAAENFSYDSMGRMTFQSSCIPSACNYTTQVSVLYDLAGNITNLTYPDGRKAQFDIGSDGRVKDVGDGTVTGLYAQSLVYNPDGSLGTLTLGNGIEQVTTENNRLQVQSLAVVDPLSTSGGTYLSHTYCYANCTTGGSANNGTIWGITDNLNASRTQGFTYDALNRISSFTLGGQLTQQYAIDSFGNMSGMVNGKPTTTFDPATNRISNLPCAQSTTPYDAKGNQLCDTDAYGMVSQYTYNSENQITSINTLDGNATPFVSYIYGADGARVRKQDNNGNFTEYVSFNGQPIAEKDQTGAWTDYIYANGQKIAMIRQAEPALHVHGEDCSSCNSGWVNTAFSSPITGYAIQQGDKLMLRQRQINITGGIQLNTQEGGSTWPNTTDDNGDLANVMSATDGLWHNRSIDLSSFAGQHVSQMDSTLTTSPPAGAVWDTYLRDVVIVSTDGSVHPVYTSVMQPGLTQSGAMGEQNLHASVDSGVALGGPVNSVTVRFTNDSCSGCGSGATPTSTNDRNLYVNSITVGGQPFTPSGGTCQYCNGSAEIQGNGTQGDSGDLTWTFSSAQSGAVTVNAYGSSDYGIYPNMVVLVNGQPVGSYTVTGSAADYAQSQSTPDNAGTHYFLDDHLGTSQLELSAGGWPIYSGEFDPYGQEIINGQISQSPTDGSDSHYKFTGKERDTESGLDYFGARYYGSSLGRFMSPDYSMNSVILELPQSWNKYSYVLNRPLYASDPDGRCPWCVGAIVGGVVEGGFDLGKQLYNNGGSLSKVSWGEVGANTVGGAVAGALAVATGGASLVESAVVGDIAAGGTANVVGGVVTRALDPNTKSDDVLSAGEISQDAVAGFVGGGVGHLAGDVIHVPDEPVHNSRASTGAVRRDDAKFGKYNNALANQITRATVTGSAATHTTNGGFSLFNWLFNQPPPLKRHASAQVWTMG